VAGLAWNGVGQRWTSRRLLRHCRERRGRGWVSGVPWPCGGEGRGDPGSGMRCGGEGVQDLAHERHGWVGVKVG
jgi:hypothetical protein